jgi:hypothetical protein
VWTYGPLGFLTTRQLYYPVPAILALLFHVGLAAATFAVLIATLRRWVSLPVAVVVAYAAGFPMAAIWGGEEALLPLAFVAAVNLLSRPVDAPTARWLWAGLGALTAFAALDKPSVGAGIGVVTVITLACAPLRARLRVAGLTAASFVGVLLAGWIGTGNPAGNLVDYARAVAEASAGYSAMAIDPPAGYHRYLVVAIVLMLAIVGWSVRYANGLRAVIGRRAAGGIVVTTAVVVWVLFKEGFVRQDHHQIVLFGAVPIIICAFANGPALPRDEQSRADTPSRGTSLVVALLVSSLIAIASFGALPPTFADPIASARGLVSTVRGIVEPSRRDDVIDAARAAQRTYYDVPPTMLTRIGDATVDVDPVEQSLAWAYPELRWHPLPTLQNYFAYTAALDDRNVDVIASAHAPQFILRQAPWSIDGRRADFDAPATRIAIECNYASVAATRRWQLVEHRTNRCDAPRELGVTSVPFGEPVRVPAAGPGEMVVAHFALHLPWWRRVADTLYKAPVLTIRVDDNATSNRFVAGTAEQPHLMAPAPTSDFRGAFRAPTIHTFELGVAGSSDAGHSATVTFTAIRVH